VKILVALANYGTNNDPFLKRVLDEYHTMPYQVDVVVLSNLPKDFGPGVEVIVGVPYKNPFAFPFAHKKLLAERLSQYDLFIYAEDDILISQRNIEAFLRATVVLLENELAGLFIAESSKDGTLSYCVLHGHYHWDLDSVRVRGEYTLARCTNEHSACFLLTQEQLRRAIASGGFLVEPHEGRYQLRETAATDPYTQCGFQKMIPISHLDDFTAMHLPNKYWQRAPWETSSVLYRQVRALLDLEKDDRPRSLLFEPETKIPSRPWSKNYYEPCRMDMISLIPSHARKVLSLGCGFGYTEEYLVKEGLGVVGIPLDSVIAACAEDKGVEVVYGGFEEACQKLAGEKFDCLLASNILHLVPDPVDVLRSFAQLLGPKGKVIVSVPNFSYLPTAWRRLQRQPYFRDLGDFEKFGLRVTTHRVVRDWFRRSGLTLEKVVWPEPVPDVYPPQLGRLQLEWRRARQRFWGIGRRILATDLIAVGKPVAN
jgi:SAM-dependent methyltransferase